MFYLMNMSKCSETLAMCSTRPVTMSVCEREGGGRETERERETKQRENRVREKCGDSKTNMFFIAFPFAQRVEALITVVWG